MEANGARLEPVSVRTRTRSHFTGKWEYRMTRTFFPEEACRGRNAGNAVSASAQTIKTRRRNSQNRRRGNNMLATRGRSHTRPLTFNLL